MRIKISKRYENNFFDRIVRRKVVVVFVASTWGILNNLMITFHMILFGADSIVAILKSNFLFVCFLRIIVFRVSYLLRGLLVILRVVVWLL